MPEGLFSPIHLVIILAIAFIFFGAKRLPELGKGLGTGIREFKSGLNELHADVTEEKPAPTVEQPKLVAADDAPAADAAASADAPAAAQETL